MNRPTILSGGLLLFGAGLLSGYYGTSITESLSEEQKSERISSPVVPESKSVPSNPSLVAGIDRSAHGNHLPPNSQVAANSSATGPDLSIASPLPHEVRLTVVEQAQFIEQQQEAIQAQIPQIEAMIQSMKENGLPEEDIRAFAETKKAMEEQLLVEPEFPEANALEPTLEEIKNDFAASLEQTGMSPSERDELIQEYLSSMESTYESAGDLNVEPSPPDEQAQ